MGHAIRFMVSGSTPRPVMRTLVAAAALVCSAANTASAQSLYELSQPTPVSASPRDWDAIARERYVQCLRLVESDPTEAYESALGWRSEGGGAAARHCIASALIKLGQFAEGASRLEATASAPDAGDEVIRADLLGQAGGAWLQADEPAEAERALTQALLLRPGDPDILVDRAIAYAVQGQFRSAVEDLSIALASRPSDLDALRLRANAWAELGRYEDAARDVARGLAYAPNDLELLLVRGRVRQALGAATPAAIR